ncbi:MAG TPA: GNAT family N-acetyltransferase [Candidatus Limnocylindrales bacterium]|nr:GNAT family N-acetyltransferase [Candidatus Limnocylindrales bacterium]
MPEAEIHVRPATSRDFEAIERVAVANDEPTTAPGWPGWLYLEHLLATATVLVAERDGALLGYGGAAVVGGRRPAAHVTDLFVDPAAHGRGVGGQLLRGLVAAVPVPDWTTCSSSEPRALTLYVRAGMRPIWPVMYLDGPVTSPPGGPAGARSVVMAPDEAAGLELGWSGRDFVTQYRHWAARPGGSAFRVEVGGRVAAVGAAREGRMGPARVLDHLAISPSADPGATLVAALATDAVRGRYADADTDPDPAIRLKLALAGPSPAVPQLLGLGFRITDHDTFCATDPALVDTARIVPDPSFG